MPGEEEGREEKIREEQGKGRRRKKKEKEGRGGREPLFFLYLSFLFISQIADEAAILVAHNSFQVCILSSMTKEDKILIQTHPNSF